MFTELQTKPGTPKQWAADVSDLGKCAGVWPSSFTWNSLNFIRFAVERDREGDITLMRYRATSGEIVVLFND